MENKFEITREIMENAETYMPIMLKEVVASGNARKCVKETNMIQPLGEDTKFKGEYGLAPTYCESQTSKARVLMTCLMVFYLQIWPSSTDMLCSIDDYDNWGKAHVLNQIERYKGVPELRGKAFDLIADYREMERYMNNAIYSVLRELNDPATRMLEAIGTMGSVDGVKEALNEIREAKDGIEKEIERQDAIIKGKAGEEDAGNDQ